MATQKTMKKVKQKLGKSRQLKRKISETKKPKLKRKAVAKRIKSKKAETKKKPLKKKKSSGVKARKSAKTTKIPIGDFGIDTKMQRQRDVAWRMIDGEAVIITPSDSTMHTLNDVGTRIWELITGTRTLRDVAGVLCEEFDVDRGRAEKDTLWFVECLAKKGLVETS